MKKRRKPFDSLKIQKAAARNAEIKEHGKLISFRPTRSMKSLKEYKREKLNIHNLNEDT